jgi:outer membrane protein TolC
MNYLIMLFFLYSLSLFSFSAMAANQNFKTILNQLINSSPEVLSQSASVEASRSDVRNKSLYWTPNANVSFQSTTYEGLVTETRTSAINANVNLFKFGSSELARQGAESKLQAEQTRLLSTTEDRENYVANLLFQLIREKKNLEIRLKNIKLKEDSLKVAQERYKQGQLPAQELEKVQIELENIKVVYNDSLLSKINLETKIKSISDVDLNLDAWPFESVLAKNIINKNKLKNAQDFYDVKTFRAEKNYFQMKAKESFRSGYLPTLDLVSTWNNSSWIENKNGLWSTSVVLTIPLWDQLSAASTSAGYTAAAVKSALNENSAIRQAKEELTTLNLRTDLIRQNVISSKRAAEKLNELRQDSLKRFRLGRSSVNDLLLDENRYLEAENALLNSMYSYHQIIVENCHKRGELIGNCSLLQ